MQEIEHRYFIEPSAIGPEADWRQRYISKEVIEQGYMSFAPEARRARIVYPENGEPHAMLTLKLGEGTVREEYESPVSVGMAQDMMKAIRGRVLKKTRYSVPVVDSSGRGQFWVIDEYHDELGGLYIAELECDNPVPPAELPSWVHPKPITENRWFTAKTLSRAPAARVFDLRDALLGEYVHE